jgi:hypothetical protein
MKHFISHNSIARLSFFSFVSVYCSEIISKNKENIKMFVTSVMLKETNTKGNKDFECSFRNLQPK